MEKNFSQKVMEIMADVSLNDSEKAVAVAKLSAEVQKATTSKFDQTLTNLQNEVSPLLGKYLNTLVSTCPPVDNDSKRLAKSLFTSKIIEHKGKLARVSMSVSIDFDPPKRQIASDPALKGRLFQKQLSEDAKKRQEQINAMWAEMGYEGPEKA